MKNEGGMEMILFMLSVKGAPRIESCGGGEQHLSTDNGDYRNCI